MSNRKRHVHEPSEKQPHYETTTLVSTLPADSTALFLDRNLFKWIALSLATVFVACLYMTPITTNDIWIQLKVGQLILSSGEIPRTILFAFTHAKDYPFFAHEWFPSVIFSLTYETFGYNALIILKFIFALTIFFLLYRLSYQLTKEFYLSLFLSGITLVCLNFRAFLRPEIVAYTLFSLQLNFYVDFLRTRNFKILFFLALSHLIWANSHGSFLVSMGLPFLFGAGELFSDAWSRYWRKEKFSFKIIFEKRFLIFWTIGSCLSILSLINPFGYHLLEHVYELSHAQYIKDLIFEWKPIMDPSVMTTRMFRITIIFSVFVGVSSLFLWRKISLSGYLLLISFSYLAWQAQRHVAVWAIACVLPLALMYKELASKRPHITAGLVCALFLTSSLFAYFDGNVVGIKPGFYKFARIEEESLDFIKTEAITGNVLNSYVLGGQLIYNFYPTIKIAIDSRIDAYGKDYMNFYQGLIKGTYDNLTRFLDQYQINTIMIDTGSFQEFDRDQKSKKLLESGWGLNHKTKKILIFMRKA